MYKLTAQRLEEIFKNCFYKDDEITDEGPIIPAVEVEGIICKFGFHPIRLNEYKLEIEQMLTELPEQFKEGGGWSFLNATLTKEGRLWGEHKNIEQLMCLGMAIGKVKYNLARDLWTALPGGMPYFYVTK